MFTVACLFPRTGLLCSGIFSSFAPMPQTPFNPYNISTTLNPFREGDWTCAVLKKKCCSQSRESALGQQDWVCKVSVCEAVASSEPEADLWQELYSNLFNIRYQNNLIKSCAKRTKLKLSSGRELVITSKTWRTWARRQHKFSLRSWWTLYPAPQRGRKWK